MKSNFDFCLINSIKQLITSAIYPKSLHNHLADIPKPYILFDVRSIHNITSLKLKLDFNLHIIIDEKSAHKACQMVNLINKIILNTVELSNEKPIGRAKFFVKNIAYNRSSVIVNVIAIIKLL